MASNHTVNTNSNEQAGDGLFQVITSVCTWKDYGLYVKQTYRPWLKAGLQWRQSRHANHSTMMCHIWCCY